MNRILVIKLGALGDFIQALGPMRAIRRHHPSASITLLTTAPFVDLAEATGYFDTVWIDTRPALLKIKALWDLRTKLRGGQFDRVYDLQTSDRSGWYFRLMGPSPPEWSGLALGSSHPQRNPARETMHTVERQRDQLAIAGIADVQPADLSWANADLSRFRLNRPYVALVPGGSAHRPAKRWPVSRYAALARRLGDLGVTPLVLGGAAERDIATVITGETSLARDLTGQTDLLEIAAIGRGAVWAVGNDTGPVHLLAATGTPTTVLFSSDSDPALTAPRGALVRVLRRADLNDLSVDEVADTLRLG